MEERCCKCNKIAEQNSIALAKKIFGVKTEIYCMECLAKELGKNEEYVIELIDYFKRQGCPAFN